MILEKLIIQNFKNHEQLELLPHPNINLIVGSNGTGKTNLLDALHYISLTKSAFQSQDTLCIKQGTTKFEIQAWIKLNDDKSFQVYCAQGIGQKKQILLNKKSYSKIHEHIGKFPLVIISPFDNDLVREGSETRRKFFDTMISQIDGAYLQNLVHYNHYLKQRNSLLKQWENTNNQDETLIQHYNQKIIPLAQSIAHIRKDFCNQFFPIFERYFATLSDSKEVPSFEYKTNVLDHDFAYNFEQSFDKDLILQRTNHGIHKDDFLFLLEKNPLKNYGSQGQQKSYVISLKLANFEIIRTIKGFPPFLLLDDIFEKLDQQRIKQLLSIISSNNFGQIFITDARAEISIPMFKNLDKKMSTFNIEKI
jgi:DNA replication and repair protein RecF